jgi:hypothetical protein
VPSFASIEADFLRITSEVVWATVATVDGEGRPRTRTNEDAAAGRFYQRHWRAGE